MSELEKLPGSKLSISNLELQMPRYKTYRETGEIETSDITTLEQEELEEKALLSFRGTQIHNLVYITQLYNRCKKLNRIPNYYDLRNTYPTFPPEDSEAMALLYEQNPEDPIEVWKQWIENCEVPTKKNESTKLPPENIMGIWLSGIDNPHVEDVVNNLEDRNQNQIEMNELFSVLNLKLNPKPGFERNIQIPSSVDTVFVTSKDSETPITITDYKSKDLSEIKFLDKFQAMLMSISVYYNIIDKIPEDPWNLSQWDVTHSLDKIGLPLFKKGPLTRQLKLNCSVERDFLNMDLSRISKKVRFVLKNPTTNESKEINFLPIAEQALDYLQDLHEFYAENKNRLKSNKDYIFLTPKLVPEKVLNPETYEKYRGYNGTQVSLF